ncbi:hypothetical protein [Virgibacillus halodenitrificans]|uniref:hypothetical protein n=1 Tax=Virgibacillus halodenitrificans TaxID=1482 RepID=UPI000EF5321A|nr:hypothetical protein [Virgibacillus halodenitrificans]
MLHQLRLNYKNSYKMRHQLLDPLTEKEKQVFIKTCDELQLNYNNLPGFFFIQFTHSFLLETPPYVWQSWFYSWNIRKNVKMEESPILSMNQVYIDLCKLINKGFFRMNKASEQKYLKHLIYECVSLYKDIGVLVDIDNERKEIRYDKIPMYQKMKPNIFVELYYNQIRHFLDFDFDKNKIPEDIRKTVFHFQNKWENSRNGYSIGDEYKSPEKVDHVVIYANQNTLDKALRILSDEQKKAISFYLKKYPYTLEKICDLLVKRHGASSERNFDGKYKILPYIEEYVFSSLWLWK